MITKSDTSVPSVLETKRQAEPLSTRLWLALAAVLAVLSLGVFIANQPAAVTSPSVAVSEAAANPVLRAAERGLEASAARYTGLAAFYAAQSGDQRGIEASATRYTGLAGFYAAQAGAQRGIEAEIARYDGLAGFYAAQSGGQRGIEAEIARYNGLAGFYAAVK